MNPFIALIITFVFFVMSCSLSNETNPKVDIYDVTLDNEIPQNTIDSIGIFIKVENLNLSTGNIVVSVINNTSVLYSTGDYYKIEKYKNGEWNYIMYKPIVFYGLGYEIPPKTSRQFTINLSDLDDDFKAGKYRITKNITSNYKRSTISTEFKVL